MLYQCDIYDQGMHIPLLLCGECQKKLQKQGATMRCVTVMNKSLKCSQCSPNRSVPYYEQRRRIVL